jgi:DNA-binding LacI/PurR family transcriptional regulator
MTGTTLKEVAKRCRMSVATVSHVLGSRADRYSEKTRKRVLQAASDLGYRPNSSARAMRSGKFNSLALLIGCEVHRSYLPDALLRGVHDAIAIRNQGLYVGILPDEKLTSEELIPHLLQQWRVDGLLINYNAFVPARMAGLIKAHRLPSVWVNANREGDAVRPDDRAGGALAVEHLLQLGHRRIAYVDLVYAENETPDHYSATERCAGYADALRKAGLKPMAIRSPSRLKGSERPAFLAAQLKAHRPTAAVAYINSSAACAIQAAQIAGLRVPRDLSVITFSDDPADVAGFTATTILLPWREVGTRAVEMLMTKIEKPHHILPPGAIAPRLHQGETTTTANGNGA